MNFVIPLGTKGKILHRIQQDEYDIEEFTAQRVITFPEDACGINPNLYLMNPSSYDPNSLGVEMVKEGYALFTNTMTFDREAEYVLAVQYDKVNII